MNTDQSIAINRARYIAWLRASYPELYTASAGVVSSAPGLSGLFDTLGSAFTSVVKTVGNSLPQLAQTYTSYRLQSQTIKANTQRAIQGLPPLMIDPRTGQPIEAIIPYTQSDLEIATMGSQSLVDASRNRSILIGVSIVGGLLLLKSLGGKRR